MEKKSEEPPMTKMAALAGETIEALAAGQAMAMATLKAEMEALGHLLPTLHADETEQELAARKRAEDAQTESDFDNMPV